MSKIKSMARVTLLLQPWLTYSQVRNKIETHVGKVATGTVGVYGSEIRPEIGCTLTTQSGREVLRVDLERYEAACEKYGVVGADKAALLAAATPNRNVMVISPKVFLGETAPAEKDAVIREDLTAKVEEAELRSTEARDRVKLLESQLSAAKQEADEAAQALQFLDDLASAPVSVIRAILG